MFTWLNKQGVQSDRGFIVQVIDRFTIEYREAGNVISVPFEFGMSDHKVCVIVRPHAFARWDNDPPNAMIPLEKQQEIFANFKEALVFQRVNVIVEEAER
jgi:hypothetical protein